MINLVATPCDWGGGCEFIAKLVELEHFASSDPNLNFDYEAPGEEPRLAPQVEGRIQNEHRFQTREKFSPVEPYRSLDASRLKLFGNGQWDMQEYLESCLWLPFQDPGILLRGQDVHADEPNFARESKEENLRLAKLWDSRGLLAIFHEQHPTGLACRVFNAHKNSEGDRQIGDRRWLNAAECHPRGLSAFLPPGSMMTSMHCPRPCKLIGCASDRKDFYHQARVSRESACKLSSLHFRGL